MRLATNHAGYECQLLTPAGWRATGYDNPYPTQELAAAAAKTRQEAAPEFEFRAYPALAKNSRESANAATTRSNTCPNPN